MDSLKLHIKNIIDTLEHIKILVENFNDDSNIQFVEYITDKYNQYINQFRSIFNPSKQIKKDMKYFADVRILVKYNENIIFGWLVEDFYIFLFNLKNVKKE